MCVCFILEYKSFVNNAVCVEFMELAFNALSVQSIANGYIHVYFIGKREINGCVVVTQFHEFFFFFQFEIN